MKPPRLDTVDRAGLADYFVDTWELYETLFSSIRGEGALYLQPDPLRQPLIFYLGHTAAFYVNKLELAGLLDRRINERFERLFAVGVDPAKAGELEAEEWPSESEVGEFRERVHEVVLEQIQRIDLDLPVRADHPAWALLMGLEHDRIHFETSSVLIRQYGPDLVERPEGWAYGPAHSEEAATRMTPIPGGDVVLGRPPTSPTYGWDNEYGRLEVGVADFEVASSLVTNSEFLEFWRDGGYERREFWDDEGWSWKQGVGARHPRFWISGDDPSDAPRYRAMFDEMRMPGSWPVEVNLLEARAYCRWKGPRWRLPTEAEFARMAREAPTVDGDPVFADAYNTHLAFGSPTPVGHMTAGRTPDGLNDVYGNVWEWLSDDFRALPGYEPHYLYRDYSEPFMDGDHGMLAGGSWASSGTSASKYYRQWFRRHFYQHAGFRLARDV